MCLIKDQSWIDCIDITSRWDIPLFYSICMETKGCHCHCGGSDCDDFTPLAHVLSHSWMVKWACFGSQGSIALNWHSHYSGTWLSSLGHCELVHWANSIFKYRLMILWIIYINISKNVKNFISFVAGSRTPAEVRPPNPLQITDQSNSTGNGESSWYDQYPFGKFCFNSQCSHLFCSFNNMAADILMPRYWPNYSAVPL